MTQSLENLVEIKSTIYWVKIIEFLQQNWALVDELSSGEFCIYFFSDDSGVFDSIIYPSKSEAISALKRNYFELYLDLPTDFQSFLFTPEPPFFKSKHPNGNIYSSGRFWY